MESEENTFDIVAGLSGAAKHELSRIPGLGAAIAGRDAYNRNRFERNVNNAIKCLRDVVGDLESFCPDDWIKSEEGQQFSRKVVDSAVDAQLEDKQELFINALINGIENKDVSYLEKMKFVDMLRHLSRASLMVLCDMHKMFKDQVRGPGRAVNQTVAIPQVDPIRIAETLGSKYKPDLVTAVIYEMESQGLFSTIHEWIKKTSGSCHPGTGFSTALTYTDFTSRFVEFITRKEQKEIDKNSTSSSTG